MCTLHGNWTSDIFCKSSSWGERSWILRAIASCAEFAVLTSRTYARRSALPPKREWRGGIVEPPDHQISVDGYNLASQDREQLSARRYGERITNCVSIRNTYDLALSFMSSPTLHNTFNACLAEPFKQRARAFPFNHCGQNHEKLTGPSVGAVGGNVSGPPRPMPKVILASANVCTHKIQIASV